MPPVPDQIARMAARSNIGLWLAIERGDYAEGQKWANDKDTRGPVAELVRKGDPAHDEDAVDFVRTYLHRALVLGLDNSGGRQAIGKAMVTLLNLAEAMTQYRGQMPEPGRPSGDTNEWVRN